MNHVGAGVVGAWGKTAAIWPLGEAMSLHTPVTRAGSAPNLCRGIVGILSTRILQEKKPGHEFWSKFWRVGSN